MSDQKLSRQPGAIQSPSPSSPQAAGMIVAFAGSSAPSGWALCNGAEVSQTTYSQLFGRISTTWNTCTNPLTGVAWGAPAGGNFRLPDLRGVFLRNAGTFAGSDAYNAANSLALGAYKVDQFQAHNHEAYASSSTPATGATFTRIVGGTTPDTSYIADIAPRSTTRPIANDTHGFPRVGYETAPKQVGINYLIKLYDDAGPIIMSGSPFIGMNFSEEYSTSSTDFTAEINKAYTANKATALAITLPAASLGAVINFKNIGAGLVTITRAGSDTIDGATSITLSQYQAIKMKCFATNLWGVY